MKQKTARRWLRRNAHMVAQFNLGYGSDVGSNFHKTIIRCKRALGDIRFRRWR